MAPRLKKIGDLCSLQSDAYSKGNGALAPCFPTRMKFYLLPFPSAPSMSSLISHLYFILWIGYYERVWAAKVTSMKLSTSLTKRRLNFKKYGTRTRYSTCLLMWKRFQFYLVLTARTQLIYDTVCVCVSPRQKGGIFIQCAMQDDWKAVVPLWLVCLLIKCWKTLFNKDGIQSMLEWEFMLHAIYFLLAKYCECRL